MSIIVILFFIFYQEFKTIALKKMLKIQPEDNFVPAQNEVIINSIFYTFLLTLFIFKNFFQIEPEYYSNKPVNYLPKTSLHELKTVELQCSNYNTNEQVNENVIPKLNSSMESTVQVTNVC